MTRALYDQIGLGNAERRRPDGRIAARISAALGPCRRVLNVGAGAGSYEPASGFVVAIEPSLEMIRQRPRTAAQAIQASAGQLPFRDLAFDAALAVLTVHHWPHRKDGLAEMRRVARERVVIFTWDPEHPGFWLVRDYFPEPRHGSAAVSDSARDRAGDWFDGNPRGPRSGRLFRRLFRCVLAPSGGIPGCSRTCGDFHFLQVRFCSGTCATAAGSRGRIVARPEWRVGNAARTGYRLSSRRCAMRLTARSGSAGRACFQALLNLQLDEVERQDATLEHGPIEH